MPTNNDTKLAMLAFLQKFLSESRINTIKQKLGKRIENLTLLLDNIYQEHNASALLRSADAFGLQYIYTIEDKNTFRPNDGVSLGSEKWLSIKCFKDKKEAIQALKSKDYKICATSSHKGENIREFKIKEGEKLALAFGTEKEGLSQEIFDEADYFLQIPMYGFAESFNVSVAAAIIMYELRQKIEEGNLAIPVSENEKLDIELEWTINSIKHSDKLIEKFLNEYEK